VGVGPSRGNNEIRSVCRSDRNAGAGKEEEEREGGRGIGEKGSRVKPKGSCPEASSGPSKNN